MTPTALLVKGMKRPQYDPLRWWYIIIFSHHIYSSTHVLTQIAVYNFFFPFLSSSSFFLFLCTWKKKKISVSTVSIYKILVHTHIQKLPSTKKKNYTQNQKHVQEKFKSHALFCLNTLQIRTNAISAETMRSWWHRCLVERTTSSFGCKDFQIGISRGKTIKTGRTHCLVRCTWDLVDLSSWEYSWIMEPHWIIAHV